MLKAYYTKDGPVYVEEKDAKEQLQEDLGKAISLQQELDAIKKYLGV